MKRAANSNQRGTAISRTQAAQQVQASRLARPTKRPRREAIREHFAIVLPRYLDRIASGVKNVQCRLKLTRREPLGLVRAGDHLFSSAKAAKVASAAKSLA